MENVQQFLVVMAALSAASQTLTEHLIKKRWAAQLDHKKADPVAEARRQSLIHLYCALIGGGLAGAIGLHPFTLLFGVPGGGHPSGFLFTLPPPFDCALEYAMTGVLASFGGGFFNDLLGALQGIKPAQAVQASDTALTSRRTFGFSGEEGFFDAACAG